MWTKQSRRLLSYILTAAFLWAFLLTGCGSESPAKDENGEEPIVQETEKSSGTGQENQTEPASSGQESAEENLPSWILPADSDRQDIMADPACLVSANGRLKLRDGVLVNEAGEPFRLTGASTHGIAWFPEYINANAFRSVRDFGGNVVRIAMYTDTDNGYFNATEYNRMLSEMAIDNAIAMDLYVIVDWHILDDGDPNANLDRAITFFDRIASRYKDEPAVIYEVCNEPNGVSWEQIRQYAYAIVPVIRQYSPDALILLGTPEYSSDLSGAMEDPFPDDNLMYTYHAYAGEHMNADQLAAVSEKIPVFVSEWGIGLDKNGGPALEEARVFLDVMKAHNISWCAWSLCNKEEAYSLIRPDCEKHGGFETEDLTEAGTLIFSSF